jgi:hypothetical protein
VPSNAESLIAYQQLATSTPWPWIFDQTTSIISTCWMCFLVESPVRVLIMTPGPGSDHVRCPPPQDPITGAFAVSTIAWDRCCWVREGQRPKQRAEWRRFE